ncbi:Leukocyte elastase inhibitor A-like protein [Dinothrombium tinctorium]|uniref:Leukocyte elastase inhibitor A-like protein n=1 Tax=Dinothrombium tinctorium TaxID=1965070 RepID=A0A443QVG7_9ACAR|nr:Leukocyte elastase inhibitor A-like protein [Dinothrombium tinctorium]
MLAAGLMLIATFATTAIINAQVISFGMRKLAHSANQFGLDLMRAMDRSDATMAFCPFCISSSLIMLLMGAHGNTASSLRHALYLWGMQRSEINLASYDMMNHLGVNLPNNNQLHSVGFFPAVMSDPRMSSSLSSSILSGNDIVFMNNIYVQREFVVNYHYHLLLQRYYKTAVHPLDFIHSGHETRQHINAIVEKQTAGKIKHILPERVTPSTQLLLLSALYFKGTLDLNISLARKPINNKPRNVFGQDPIMLEAKHVRIRYGFNRYLNCTTIEMPFKGGLITLVAVMPNDPNGLDTLLTRLSAQVLSDVINGLEVKRVSVKMPRISFEAGNRNLSMALSNMGLADLFKPGYSQLYDISDYKWLHVSDIIHKTYLDIKENDEPNNNHNNNKNSKSHQKLSDSVDVNFDKPFLFFIMDSISGLILAMGKIGREPVNYRLPIN